MRAVLTSLILLSLPVSALADGRVFPPIAVPTEVTMPDQRALIHFTNGTERLVIETRFTAAGSNFAWVIPLPSQPVVEPATTGVFPTLQLLFQPRVTHNVPRYYLGILLGLLFLVLLVNADRSVWHRFLFLVAVAVAFFFLAALLLPVSLSKSRGESGSEPDVTVLDRRLVGIFETTTLAARDPKELRNWLLENGFAAPPRAEPVIADYVKEGWVFVAAKVRRDHAGMETSTPHPLSFTFQTDKPVYPMRLTGVDNGPLQVELYVFGPAQASARHFKVKRCTQPAYPDLASRPGWSRRAPETPGIMHPLLRRWLDGSPVATKLTAMLSPANMRQDVWIDWEPFREKQDRRFSAAGALTLALNWAVVILVVAWLWLQAFVFVHARYKPGLPKMVGALILLSAGLAGGIYLSLPKTEVRLVRGPFRASEYNQANLYHQFKYTNAVSLSEARIDVQRFLAAATNSPSLQTERYLRNDVFGGPIREEDSPGNFVLRLNKGRVEFVAYDSRGAPQVLGDWPAR